MRGCEEQNTYGVNLENIFLFRKNLLVLGKIAFDKKSTAVFIFLGSRSLLTKEKSRLFN